MSGSAIDITVLGREDHREVDRGGSYLELSECTPMCSPFIGSYARHNRQEITTIMTSHGFVPYPYEFWHYSKNDVYCEYLSGSGKPACYGAVFLSLSTGSTTPTPDTRQPLHSTEEIRREIKQALKRLDERC